MLGVVAAISMLLPPLSDLAQQTDTLVDYSEGTGGSLSWEQYQNHCHQPAWEQSSVALVQLRCSHLTGYPVGWDGYVTDVRIRSISNTLEEVFSRWVCSYDWYGHQTVWNCHSGGAYSI
jgi:wolfamin